MILSPGRARRPSDYRRAERVIALDEACPFCPGNESETPSESLAYRESGAPDGPGWQVRVFPNKYPAVSGDAGIHEVLAESPEHSATLADMPPEQVTAVIRGVRERFLFYKEDARWLAASLFKNQGPAAGATREHPHLQLMALPFVPPLLERELSAGLEVLEREGECHWCSAITGATDRIVSENRHFVALAPFAARFPYETHILPKRHGSHFEAVDPGELAGLADQVSGVIRRLDGALGQRPFNITLMSGPLREGALAHYHWRLEVLPRLGILAGFEFGTGCYINSVAPEKAAERLRVVEV